ncbi:hypothetical protein JCGZ_08734 [Jatropha curcas]|uniref:Glutaredoxin domain-containing protein n=2 Tax=Jatropha curcas TaxID=180498 RepID=A0A067KUY6_JATCU|nr:hypothetical protein JCGZ_08734 [Jatropha curcas]
MKSMKGTLLLKKMKFIQSLNTLKHTLVPHHHQNPEVITSALSVSEPIKDFKDKEEEEVGAEFEDKDIKNNPLLNFEEKCPPEGKECVVLYTTSLRSIRKTFEDCQAIRFLLESFKVKFYERDVSMDLEFREELWRVLGCRVIPPKLFIKGKYIGGADEVVILHEQGMLKKLFEGIPLVLNNTLCACCGNKRFVVCFNCNGSRKVFVDGESGNELCIRCPDCNENGLVKCSICC